MATCQHCARALTPDSITGGWIDPDGRPLCANNFIILRGNDIRRLGHKPA